MKLGYIVPQFPGQTHAFFWREIQALEALGIEVKIFSTRPPPRGLVSHDWSETAIAGTTYLGLGETKDRIAAAALLPRLVTNPTLRNSGKAGAKSVLISAPAAMFLRRLCRTWGIRHVHAHSAGNSAMIAALSRHAGGPSYSVTLHGALSDYGPAQNFKWGGAAFGVVVTQTLERALRQALVNECPEQLIVCPMGVDVDGFRPSADYVPWKSTDGPLRLFSCARLNPGKGHDTAISAVKRLLQAGITAHLTIAGEDDAGGSGYRADLQRHIQQSGIASQVTLLGAVNSDRIRQHLQQAHVFVLASNQEAIGVAYMEAMACGCPTIGTKVGGVGELIRDGQNGLLVAPKDPQALAAAIERIAQDEALSRALSKAGRACIVDSFSSRRSARVIHEQLSQLEASGAFADKAT